VHFCDSISSYFIESKSQSLSIIFVFKREPFEEFWGEPNLSEHSEHVFLQEDSGKCARTLFLFICIVL
jgi:hypothetical protein